MTPTASRSLVGALLGAGASLVGDHLHVTQGVLSYPHVACWGQAWWVFPLFFGATFALFATARRVHPGAAERPAVSVRAAAGDFLGFFTAYAFTAFASSMPDLVLWVLVGAWGARVLGGMPPRQVVLCLVIAIGGTSWEAMWSGLGMFSYSHPDLLGVPRWLPALYLHAAVAVDSARCVVDAHPAVRA